MKLDETKHIVKTGMWKKTSAGGCHLHSDEYVKGSEASWQLNPKYLLVLKGQGKSQAEVELVLSRPQWKLSEAKRGETMKAGGTQDLGKEEKKRPLTIVGTMMGLYIFENKGQKMIRRADIREDVVFYPKNEVIVNKTLECNESGYIVMPCTFEVCFIHCDSA